MAAAAMLWAPGCSTTRAVKPGTQSPGSADSPTLDPATSPATTIAQPSDTSEPELPAAWIGNEVIAMLIYPEMTALDFVGPQYFFGSLMGATVHHVAADLTPVTSDTGVTIAPTITMDECPAEVDILFVPGGTQGTLNALRSPKTVDFVASRGATAKRVTSVCTGSLLLGAAGLLDGYRATSHWMAQDLLPLFGATPVAERFVKDRNRYTGAGVSAGLDFGLALLREIRDTDYAQVIQLICEYDPQPPLQAGSPQTAPKEAVDAVSALFEDFHAAATAELT
jgi:cyclohexyl-isocyanide hydratase